MISWIRRIIKKYGQIFIAGFAFAIICFIVLNLAMEPVSTSEYCGSKCHEMNTAYQSWELSTHGSNVKGIRVACIECHLPPKDRYFSHIIAKAYAPTDLRRGMNRLLANLGVTFRRDPESGRRRLLF